MQEFTVYMRPATKGSTASFIGKDGRVVTLPDCGHLAGWTQAVGWAARLANLRLIERPFPVRVKAVFQFQRPKKPRASMPSVRPDLDKLARALLDALTGVAYEDDAQVCSLDLFKIYGEDTRTTVCVMEVSHFIETTDAIPERVQRH